MKVIFPDPKALQPMPQDVSANISHNINSATSAGDFELSGATTQENTIAPSMVIDSQPAKSYIAVYVAALLVLIALVLATVMIYRRIKSPRGN